MTMTPEKASALRKPFPPEAIGKLPKPMKSKDQDRGKCDRGSRYSADGHYCGGWHARSLHLDFVGHAATTDRLLQVDPEWSWEPLALDDHGLPALDRAGNLWIRLTICGVTRIGVGDGSSAKECIGDAIRNAAMRFGVALDLWSKEDLEGAHADQEPPAPADPERAVRDQAKRETRQQAGRATPTPPPVQDTGEAITDNTRGRIFALMSEAPGLADADAQRDFLGDTLDRDVTTRSDLTEAEAQRAIQRLVAWQKGDPAAAWSPLAGTTP